MDLSGDHIMMEKLKNIFIKVIPLILIIAAFFGGYYLGKYPLGGAKTVPATNDSAFDLKLPGETEKARVTVDDVKATIHKIGELTFCEGKYEVTKGKDYTRHMFDDIPVFGTTNHVELTCTGSVKAGYNVDDINIKVDNDSKKIYVSLPDIQINSNQIYWDDSMVCNEQNNILNPIDFEQYQSLIEEIKEEGREKAKTEGLYDTVEDNAKNVITNFLGCFNEYKVEFM
jgi:hypothetical protein